jgi:anthranilate phosphoribosyltransferase
MQIVKWTVEGVVKGKSRVFHDVTHTLVARDMLVSCRECGLFYYSQIKVASRIVALFVLDRAKALSGIFLLLKFEEGKNMYKKIMAKITNRQELFETEIFELISAINEGTVSDIQIAGFQVALLMKGASLQEIAYIAKAMRDNCVPLRPKVDVELMDTCGTGGGLSTFNISTATAIVAAAAGIPIAKHGSRSIASLSGSADVLEALGVNINLESYAVEKMVEEIGIAFLYAPLFHPVMGKVLPPEQDLGIKTIFYSIIGPLINPAFASRHLLGVYKPELLDTVTYVAKALGYTNAMFVHGLDGLDEISLLGKTRINHLKNGEITAIEIEPEDFGLTRCKLEDIKTGTPDVNAETVNGVFSGKIKGARRDAIVLNAAGALIIGDKADDFKSGIAIANEIIDSGSAAKKLQELREMSNSLGRSV